MSIATDHLVRELHDKIIRLEVELSRLARLVAALEQRLPEPRAPEKRVNGRA